jgi:hypothetical protein
VAAADATDGTAVMVEAVLAPMVGRRTDVVVPRSLAVGLYGAGL